MEATKKRPRTWRVAGYAECPGCKRPRHVTLAGVFHRHRCQPPRPPKPPRPPRLPWRPMKGERRLLGEWMLQDTNSNVEVARALGVSRELVRKWRKALGLPPVAKELSRRIDGVGVQNNQ